MKTLRISNCNQGTGSTSTSVASPGHLCIWIIDAHLRDVSCIYVRAVAHALPANAMAVYQITLR